MPYLPLHYRILIVHEVSFDTMPDFFVLPKDKEGNAQRNTYDVEMENLSAEEQEGDQEEEDQQSLVEDEDEGVRSQGEGQNEDDSISTGHDDGETKTEEVEEDDNEVKTEVLDLGVGRLDSRYEAAVLYLMGWIDARLKNIWKAKLKIARKSEREQLEGVVDLVGDNEDEDEDGDDSQDDNDEESASKVHINLLYSPLSYVLNCLFLS